MGRTKVPAEVPGASGGASKWQKPLKTKKPKNKVSKKKAALKGKKKAAKGKTQKAPKAKK